MPKFFSGYVTDDEYSSELERVVSGAGYINKEVYASVKSDVVVYKYRRLFGLSYREFLDEPTHEFVKNIKIWSAINKEKQNGKRN